MLDVTFKDDLARVRKGHRATKFAAVRHFAIDLVRNAPDERSFKTRRKLAEWSPDYLADLIQTSFRSPGSWALMGALLRLLSPDRLSIVPRK